MRRGAAQQEVDRTRPSLTAIQGLVHDVLDDVLAHMGAVLEADVPFINEVSFHLQRVRGKLFRPALLALANRVEERPDNREVALGAVIEIIHMATLVHDDSIDRSSMRRGRPTLNSRWGHKVSVIMGDYLYSRAMTEITRIGDLELIGLAARVTNDLTIGEMVEIAHHGQLVEDPRQYFFLIEKKTASLISTACEMGAAIGAPEQREPLKEYGRRLGMAFQLIDDLMDYGLPHLSPAERRSVNMVFEPQEQATPDDIQRVVELVRDRGGIEATRRIACEYADRARETLEGLPATPSREVMDAAVDYVLARDR
jgi:octaprenyl-diphosphate synthase